MSNSKALETLKLGPKLYFDLFRSKEAGKGDERL